VFPRIEAFGHSDVGCVREVNEDNFLCVDLSPHGGAGFRPGSYLLAVADGIGGHAGGSVASDLAVQTLRAEVRILDGREPRECLLDVFQRANRLIFEKSVREPDLTGMGTTLAAAIVIGTRVVAANVGDSRLYLFRDGDLSQVTEDHSWAAEQRRRRLLSEHDIRHSPFRSMITRSLGYAEEVIVDMFAVEAEEDDVLLFCTDGLHGLVPGKRIAKILKKNRDPKATSQALIEAAKAEGGDDNVTVVIARFSPSRNDRPAFSTNTVRISALPEDP